jgi:hypothetical protein
MDNVSWSALLKPTALINGSRRLLVRHPQAMERLRREITAVMGDRMIPVRADIKKMPYLSFVIKESESDGLPWL